MNFSVKFGLALRGGLSRCGALLEVCRKDLVSQVLDIDFQVSTAKESLSPEEMDIGN